MGFIKNIFKFIISPTSSRTTGILVILIIAAAVPLTVFIAQQQQELRQRAAESSAQDCQNQKDQCVNQCSQEGFTPEEQDTCVSPCYITLNNCLALIPTPTPTAAPTSTPIVPATSSSRCDSPNGSVRTDGASQYVCSSQKPPAGSNCKSASNFSCVNLSDTCYVCPITGTAPTATPVPPYSTPTPFMRSCSSLSQTDPKYTYTCSNQDLSPRCENRSYIPGFDASACTNAVCWRCPLGFVAPTSTPVPPTATTVPAPPAQAPGSKKLCIYKSNVDDLSNKFSKGEGVSLRDINSLARSYGLADNTCKGQ